MNVIYSLILLYLSFIILKDFVFTYFWKKHLTRMRDKTKAVISSFEYVMSINGLMGKGKTSLSVGIITDLSELISLNIDEELNKTRAELYKINFLEFDNRFEEYFEKNIESCNFKIFKLIDNFLTEEKYKETGFFTDFLVTESIFYKLVKYCIRYYVLNIRGILVYSKGYLFNRFTKTNAFLLDDTGLEMVNALFDNNWQFELGTIYFDDELSITRGNRLSGSKIYKSSGMTITLALIRNLSLGTTYRITTKQFAKNEEYQDRQLSGSTIIIDKVNTVLTTKWLRSLLLNLDGDYVKILTMYLKIYCFLTKTDSSYISDYFSTNTVYRKIHYYIIQKCNLLFSKGYNIYHIRNYYNVDDVGKENNKQFNYYSPEVLVFPLNYVYGNYDTHEYFYKLFALDNYTCAIDYVETSNTDFSVTNKRFIESLKSIKK